MMEIINKKHEAIGLDMRSYQRAYIKFERKLVYFPAVTVTKFGYAIGLYVHFVQDDDKLFFYVNDDKDGFPFKKVNSKNSLMVCSISLINVLFKNKPFEFPCSFPVNETKSKIKSCSLMEIKLNKPIEHHYSKRFRKKINIKRAS